MGPSYGLPKVEGFKLSSEVPILSNQARKQFIREHYNELMGKPFSEAKSSDFEHFVYHGILMPAAEGDLHAVMFNLDDYGEWGNEENRLALVNHAQKIAHKMGHEKLSTTLTDYANELKQYHVRAVKHVHETTPTEKGVFSPSGWKQIFKTAFVGLLIFSSIPGVASSPVNDLCQMKQFSIICKGHLGIERAQMPQLDNEVKGKFLSKLISEGVSVIQTKVRADTLLPAQKEMNYKKVQSIVENATTQQPCDNEIVVTSGDRNETGAPIYRIIDGHHRYAACRIQDGDQSVVAIDAFAHDIFDRLKTFPGVYQENLGSFKEIPPLKDKPQSS